MDQKVLTGWHGTTKLRYKKIKENFFKITPYNFGREQQRYPNDLGNGVYFYLPFLRDKGNIIAEQYARKFKNKEIKYKNTSVSLIKANVTYQQDRVLDLNSEKNIEFLENMKKVFEDELIEEMKNIKDDGAKKRASKQSNNMGLIIELVYQLYEEQYDEKNFDIVIMDTYTDIPHLKRDAQGNNGREVSVRKLDLIDIIPKEE